MTRLHQGVPHHAHRPVSYSHHAPSRNARTGFADDWHAGRSSRRTGTRHGARQRPDREPATSPISVSERGRAHGVSGAAFALTLLTVSGLASVAVMPCANASAPRALIRRQTSLAVLPQANLTSGIFGLLNLAPSNAQMRDIAPACKPSPDVRPLGNAPLRVAGADAWSASEFAYRRDVQRAVVTLIREAVAASDRETREAFANAEMLMPFRMFLNVEQAAGPQAPARPAQQDRPARRVTFEATHAIVLMLRSPEGQWREYALSLSDEAPGLISEIRNCVPRHTFWPRCYARTHGPTLWGKQWPSIESRIRDDDELRFWTQRAGASISPGWPLPASSVLDSPDMEEIAELLIDTVQQHLPRDRREAPHGSDADAARGSRPRRHASPADAQAAAQAKGLAARMALAGFECLAAVVRPDTLRKDALALLTHLWPESSAANTTHVTHAAHTAHATHATYAHESFESELGRGVQWTLPPDVYVEYRPELTQNGVQVFEIDGVLYGTTVARTRKHASNLRPLDDIRAEAGPYSLCRISRGMGADVDGMCLECHSERRGQVTVTEQGATVTQHQVIEASPVLRLRVAVYSQQFEAPDGRQRFFAFGRLGALDDDDVPHVGPDSPVVDASVYLQTLDGELAFFEQATSEGPVGGWRVHLTLGGMQIAAPFGTYRDRHRTLHGVVQVSHDIYYRFSLPDRQGLQALQHVRLNRRDAQHHDIREYRIAQRHRAAAENAIVLPSISYGETRTLLQLYLRMWEQAPSPAQVWRGLEDIPLSVTEARQAVRQLTRAIEHRVAAARAGERGTGHEAASADQVDGAHAASPPEVDPSLLPTFHRLWTHWQRFPTQADAFVNAIARDFVSRPSPLAVWSQLPFTGDVQTTREVLSLFEEVFPGMSGLQALVTGRARAVRDVHDRLRALSRNANIALAEVTLADGTRVIYYCMSGLQRASLPTNAPMHSPTSAATNAATNSATNAATNKSQNTSQTASQSASQSASKNASKNAPTVRFVDAGRAYAQREQNVIHQQLGSAGVRRSGDPTEPPELRFVVADANMPTYHAASGEAKSRTLDTERLILAQIYADHPSGEGVVRSIVMCSRMPFCDSCAVNLAMAPYHYPDPELRFYYVAPPSRNRAQTPAIPTPATTTSRATPAPRRRPGANAAHVHSTL
ncbi:hypothetical protein [Pandoraea anhela]|uniref:Uncharacterized protein n=1 Tax=Pandoraea anhela TaxID=2508295 RepID=A0A5E4RD98_9BURK|nr:hypothetical protein [Pandoraea anhela]VVD60771.1 hypothetical protein PAN31108_00097 [Pandoraea anhela]